MEPSKTRVRLLELVNAVRRLPASGAADQVQRATVALAEAMDFEGLTAEGIRGDARGENGAGAPAPPRPGSAVLPDSFRERLEGTSVRWRDRDHPLEITRVAAYPKPPLHRIALDITVRTRHLGRDVEVTCRVRPAQLQDEAATGEKIANTMRSLLEGQMAPGAVAVL